jgi:hypothetical protein
MKNKRVYPVILTPADNIILVEVPDMEILTEGKDFRMQLKWQEMQLD